MPRDPTRDIVRGLTSLEMTFVNVSHLPWTQHSPRIGPITYADTIFPCFAFLAGMSPGPRRRSIGLVGLGIGLNVIAATAAAGKPTTAVRALGVLQRLGLASLIANEPALEPLKRFGGGPLLVMWYVITLLGANDCGNPMAHPDFPDARPGETAQTKIDRFFVGQKALYRPDYEPEGLLGSLTTAVSMLIGRAFEEQPLTVAQKAISSIGMIAIGETLHLLLPKHAPISKSLWTPSFVLVTSGVSILKYLLLESVIPHLPAAVRDLLSAVGQRSLEVYILSTLLTILLKSGGLKGISARGTRWTERMMGSVGTADFCMSAGLVGIVAASARIMVARDVRLRW